MIVLDAFGNPVVGGPDIGQCYTVETTAALRLFTVEPPAGTMVVTLGDAAQGDGNGGFWYWVPNSTLADNGVTVVKCTAILSGRFYRDGLEGTGMTQLTGDVTAGPGSASQAATITALAVTTGKIADLAVTTAKLADTSVTAGKLGTDAVIAAKVQDDAVTNAKLADMAAATIKGRALGAGTGDPTDLTATQARAAMGLGTLATQDGTFSGTHSGASSGTNTGDQAMDLRDYAVSRAVALLSLTYPTVAVDEPFVSKVGSFPSFFINGTSTNVTALDGGWKKIVTTATPGNTSAWNADTATAQVVSNVGTKKWYQLWLIKLDNSADSTAQVQLGWIDTGFAVVQPLCGMQGSGSTTKFRFYDGSSGVASTVNMNTSVHMIEMWGDGTGTIRGSVDSETAVSYSTAKTNAVTPFVQVVAGSGGAQGVSIGHLLIVTSQS